MRARDLDSIVRFASVSQAPDMFCNTRNESRFWKAAWYHDLQLLSVNRRAFPVLESGQCPSVQPILSGGNGGCVPSGCGCSPGGSSRLYEIEAGALTPIRSGLSVELPAESALVWE